MPTPQLDHIVILLPYALLETPPSWLSSHFTISPGGRHGDNKTENKLIVFRDGSYLELIAFIDDDPTKKEGHWWGDKGYGIIDYAFTLKEGPDEFAALSARTNALDMPESCKLQELKGGSRLKPDGERIEWRVAFPQGESRGRVPFWCFDVTPRERRVTIDPALTSHPCGAVGVADFSILESPEHLSESINANTAALSSIMTSVLGDATGRWTWLLDAPRHVDRRQPCRISLKPPREQHEKDALKQRTLVAKLTLLTGKEAAQGVRQQVEGDQLSIKFATV